MIDLNCEEKKMNKIFDKKNLPRHLPIWWSDFHVKLEIFTSRIPMFGIKHTLYKFRWKTHKICCNCSKYNLFCFFIQKIVLLDFSSYLFFMNFFLKIKNFYALAKSFFSIIFYIWFLFEQITHKYHLLLKVQVFFIYSKVALESIFVFFHFFHQCIF